MTSSYQIFWAHVGRRGCQWACLLALSSAPLFSACKPKGAGPGTGTGQDTAPPLATLANEVAKVSCRLAARGQKEQDNAATADQTGTACQHLLAGDVVKTDATGEVDVVFAGNNRVHLGPNSALLLRADGGTASQVGAIVLSGRARVHAGNAGVALAIGTPMGMAKFAGLELSVMDVALGAGPGQGLTLTTGAVTLARPDRLEVLPLTINETLTLDALPVLLPEQQMLGAPANEAALTVASRAPSAPLQSPARASASQGAERQPAGHGRWQPLRAGEVIYGGDHVRVLGPDSRLDVRLADGMALQLRPSAPAGAAARGELVLTGVGETPEGRRARYKLLAGQADVEITTLEGRPAQEASVDGLRIQVTPGAREARVALSAGGDGNVHVLVRLGTAQLGNQILEAGEATDVARGSVAAPYAAYAQPVQLVAGQDATLFVTGDASRSLPPIRFGAAAAGAHHTELSPTKDFARVTLAENTQRAPLALDPPTLWRAGDGSSPAAPPAAFWRDGNDSAPGTQLAVARESSVHCQSCQRLQRVEDDGASTVLRYQNDVPRVVLHWSPVAEATAYQVQVVRADAGGDVTQPSPLPGAWSQRVAGTQIELPAVMVRDTAYRWSVTPLGKDKEPLAAAKDNLLRFSLDNTVEGLRVRAPAPDAVVRGPSVNTYGEVELGCRLEVGGQPVRLGEQGDFQLLLPKARVPERIIYTVHCPNKADSIYVRDLHWEATPDVASRTNILPRPRRGASRARPRPRPVRVAH